MFFCLRNNMNNSVSFDRLSGKLVVYLRKILSKLGNKLKY